MIRRAVLLAVLAFAGCDAPVPGPTGKTVAERDGAALYASQCASCHGADGQGIAGLHPPLANSEWTTGAAEPLIALTLNGLAGELKIGAATYRGVMPAWSSVLDDAQIAAVLSYTRQAWGNRAPEIRAIEVTRVRRDTAERNAFWTPAELQNYRVDQ